MFTSLGFLYYRNLSKGPSWFFEQSRGKGIIRPRPQEAFHLCAGSYCFSTILNGILILTNTYPNSSWAIVGGHLPFVVGFSILTLYPIGLVYSLSGIEHESITDSFLLRKRVIDAIGFFFLIGPTVTLLPTLWIKGVFLRKDDIISAKNTSIISCLLLIWWTIMFLGMMISFWLKMDSVLRKHISILKNQKEGNEWKLKRVQSVSRHLTLVVGSITILYISRIFVSLLKSIFRRDIQLIIGFSAFDLFSGLVFTQFGQIIIIYNFLRLQVSTVKMANEITRRLSFWRKNSKSTENNFGQDTLTNISSIEQDQSLIQLKRSDTSHASLYGFSFLRQSDEIITMASFNPDQNKASTDSKEPKFHTWCASNKKTRIKYGRNSFINFLNSQLEVVVIKPEEKQETT
ncbi:hypothetical protein G9A89_009169 [Geosiphon pyriformis]|nr:hypothetical protein G9A89_009169 [Geosiphon pyriformis]